MSLKLHTAPTAAAVTLAEAKTHLRVTSSAEDALITSIVAAATAEAEHFMGRAVMPQKWLLSADAFGTIFELQRPIVTAIDSIKYTSPADGTEVTVDPANYQLIDASDYGAFAVPAFGLAWPVARSQPASVRVLFSCGYVDAAAVPEPIKSWIKLRVGGLYENRQAWTQGKAIERKEFVDHLLDRYRTYE